MAEPLLLPSVLALRVQWDGVNTHSVGGNPMRKLLGALLLSLAIACTNNDRTSPGFGSVSGNYLLRTANGTAVPGVASLDASGSYEVLHGRIVLRSDMTFVDSLTDR